MAYRYYIIASVRYKSGTGNPAADYDEIKDETENEKRQLEANCELSDYYFTLMEQPPQKEHDGINVNF